jgi:hypothetical protein
MSLRADEQNDWRGSRQPRIRSVPAYSSSAGVDAIELAAMAGLYLDGWQQDTLTDGLGERPEWQCSECIYRTAAGMPTPCSDHPKQLIHPWSAPTVAIVGPRQNGILEARELAGLYLLGERVIVHSAHLQRTASAQFKRLLALIKSAPDLENLMRRPIYGKGSEAIEMKSGQIIYFMTRTSGGTRGESIDLIVFDEAYQLPESAISAMVPTLSARPNTQTWYTSSAVDQQKYEHGHALTRQRERGRAGKPDIAYFEWSVEGDDPARVPDAVASDPAYWAQANPGLGIRLTVEKTQGEYDGGMGRREFIVERLGVGDWPATNGSARVIDVAQWQACQVEEFDNLEGRPCFAFDVTPDRSWASIAVAGKHAGVPFIDIIDHDEGTAWVAPRLAALKATHRPFMFLCDAAGPAGSLLPELDALGIKEWDRKRSPHGVRCVSMREYGQACGMFYDAVMAGKLEHLGTEVLDEALDGAAKRPLGDAWAWDRRKSSSADISPLVACTLALFGNAHRPAPAHFTSLSAALAAT